MIFQEPTTSLNPCFTIGFQITESLRQHLGLDRKAAKRRAIELLEQVGIPAAESRLSSYPHQLSGGMNQRVMIAMAIACNPKLLIADEPTTALDVTIQAQILDLLLSLQRERGMALVLITHNMGVVAETADRMMVMYAGQVMEEQPAKALFAAPQHPYTAALLAALPSAARAGGSPPSRGWCRGSTTGRAAACSRRAAPTPPIIRATSARPCGPGRTAPCAATTRSAIPPATPASVGTTLPGAAPVSAQAPKRPPSRRPSGERPRRRRRDDLRQTYEIRRGLFREPARLQAVGGISFSIEAGRTLAVVGESGCGKSTLARMVTLIEPPTDGRLTLDGIDAVDPPSSERRRLRRTVQLVFQNPYGSLNPRKRVGAILEQPLAINTGLSGPERRERVRAMMAKVGLRPEHDARYPHMFSGGQRQRIAIARA